MQSAVEMYLDSPTSSTSVYARPSIHDNSNDNAGEGTSFQRSNQLNKFVSNTAEYTFFKNDFSLLLQC